jgi:cellulose synthase/poly-beta-1,6-N-acetylglucosamine synthase-like glycosyltransferase
MILLIGTAFLISAIFPYLVYLAGITIGSRPGPLMPPREFPFISIIIPAYNEETIIGERIRNIAQSNYSADRYEVIIIDDASTDRTRQRAESAFKEYGIKGEVLPNRERQGTNRSFNRGIGEAQSDILITTGADVFFEPDALRIVVSRLLSGPEIGAVCADMQPLVPDQAGLTVQRERAYRDYYGLMCRWESAVDSTFNFNGGLVAFRKGAVARIRERKGSDDANTAFEVIRSGKRALYENAALVYEDIPEMQESQAKQKIRRAKRLIEATLANLDLLKQNRPFSRVFYPLRIWMNIASPALFIAGIVLVLAGIALLALPAAAFLAVLLMVIVGAGKNIVSVFVLTQYYLFRGLLNLGKDTVVWESTSKKS